MAHLHFSGTRAIESGGHDIKDANNGNGDKEPREDDRYQDYSSDNVGKGVEEHAEGVCEDKFRIYDSPYPEERTSQYIVNCVDVLGESVHDTTNWLRTRFSERRNSIN
jgi:hypothetical protein